MGQGISLTRVYSRVPRNATVTDRQQPSCSPVIASESNQISAAGKLLALRPGRPDRFPAAVQTEVMGSIHSSLTDITNLSDAGLAPEL